MGKRIRVGVIFGGKSGEHEVSVQSAKSILQALDQTKYLPVPIAIDKEGRWLAGKAAVSLLGPDVPVCVPNGHDWSEHGFGEAAILPSPASALTHSGAIRDQSALSAGVDVVFPVLHGSFGEDGTVQGLLEILNIPYVGAGVLASALGMDKVFMKRAFAAAGLPQVEYTHCTRKQFEQSPDAVVRDVETKLRYPCFVKPANLGSSVGISKAKNREELVRAIAEASRFDRKVIIEQGLNVREIEVAVLGNDSPEASVPGEVVPAGEFYDYQAKYVSGESRLLIPAPVDDALAQTFRSLAIQAFQAIDAAGMARVDFFLELGTGRVLVNEINTIPGFTRYSMYPKLWEASGLPYSKLLDRLIELALERHAEKQRTVTDFHADLRP
ncbi:MAG: D-alanine--D-alanine ligase [Alicyclobacillaceae bacterium]|nr:D-alanine--D-alanine ligase [Alicyclobacillaceae bacterium]